MKRTLISLAILGAYGTPARARNTWAIIYPWHAKQPFLQRERFKLPR